MIKKIANQVKHFGETVTLVSAGPSRQMEALHRLSKGLLISVNNAIDAPYQFLFDAVEPEADDGTGIYPKRIKDKVGDGIFFQSREMGRSREPIHHGYINRDYPTDSQAVAFCCLHEAQEIRLIGFDFFNPWNRTKNFIGADEEMLNEINRFETIPEKMLREQPKEREWERYQQNKTMLELTIDQLKNEYGTTFYNLSPVSEIRGTERLDVQA